jgi:hypothetical protein
MPEATMVTTMEVVAEEDWTMAVQRMPRARPSTGLLIWADTRKEPCGRTGY